jgi:hypothetical protein
MNQEGANMTGSGLQTLGGEGGSRVVVSVAGRPRTKGSLKPVHRKLGPGRCSVSLTESGEYSKPWLQAIVRAIKAQCVAERYAGPVVVDCFFRFDRLCSTDPALDWPTREQGTYAHGDEDKLRRQVLDALTQSGLILDDSLSIGGANYKRWTWPEDGETCGVLIGVRPAMPTDIAVIRAMERDALSARQRGSLAAETASGVGRVGVGASDGS